MKLTGDVQLMNRSCYHY